EKQARKFTNDLKRLLPEINSRKKSRDAEIVEKAKTFPLVYSNITVVFTHTYQNYDEGSMSISDVAISHQNFQTPERLIKKDYALGIRLYALTFSMPLFEEETAEKSASSNVRKYRPWRELLTSSDYKTRLAAVINLYGLAKQDSSLEI